MNNNNINNINADGNIVEKIIQDVKLKLISNLLETQTDINFDNCLILFKKCLKCYVKHPNVVNNEYFLKEQQTIGMCLNILNLSVQFFKFSNEDDEKLREHIYTLLRTSGEQILLIFYREFKNKDKNNMSENKRSFPVHVSVPPHNNIDNYDSDCDDDDNGEYKSRKYIFDNFKYRDQLSPILLQYLKQSYHMSNLTIEKHSWPTLVARSVEFIKNYNPMIMIPRQKLILQETLLFLLTNVKIFENEEITNRVLVSLIKELYKCEELSGHQQKSQQHNESRCCIVQ
jgi:hypothetical protein